MGDFPAITVSEVVMTKEKIEASMSLSCDQDRKKPDCDELSHHNQISDDKTSDVDETETVDDVLNPNVVCDFWGSTLSPESNTKLEADQDDKMDAVPNEQASHVKASDHDYPPLGGNLESSLPVKLNGWLDVAKNPQKFHHAKVKPASTRNQRVEIVTTTSIEIDPVSQIPTLEPEQELITECETSDDTASSVSQIPTLELKQERVTSDHDIGPVSQTPTLEPKQETISEYGSMNDIIMQEKLSTHKKQGATEIVLRNGFGVLSGIDDTDDDDVESTQETVSKVKCIAHLQEREKRSRRKDIAVKFSTPKRPQKPCSSTMTKSNINNQLLKGVTFIFLVVFALLLWL